MNEMCLIHFYARVHISYVRRKYLEHRKMEIKLIGFGLLFSAKSLAETQLRFFFVSFFAKLSFNCIWRDFDYISTLCQSYVENEFELALLCVKP